MSDSSSDSRNAGSGRQRRSGGPRRRSGGQRNNRNSTRSNNRGDGGGGGGSGGGSGQGRRSGGASWPGPKRQTKPAPLTFWQKILKAIGLYDPDKPAKRTSPSRVPKPPEKKIKAKSKTKSGSRPPRAEDLPVESNRLYVGNLSYDATEYDLEDLFKGIGTVKNVEIVYNNNTHRSKGFGFVTMTTVAEAQRAVDTLHDQSFMDRQLIVSGSKSEGPAQTPTSRPPVAERSFDLAPRGTANHEDADQDEDDSEDWDDSPAPAETASDGPESPADASAASSEEQSDREAPPRDGSGAAA